MNNNLEGNYIWNIPGKDNILKFENNDLPLVEFDEE